MEAAEGGAGTSRHRRSQTLRDAIVNSVLCGLSTEKKLVQTSLCSMFYSFLQRTVGAGQDGVLLIVQVVAPQGHLHKIRGEARRRAVGNAAIRSTGVWITKCPGCGPTGPPGTGGWAARAAVQASRVQRLLPTHAAVNRQPSRTLCSTAGTMRNPRLPRRLTVTAPSVSGSATSGRTAATRGKSEEWAVASTCTTLPSRTSTSLSPSWTCTGEGW